MPRAPLPPLPPLPIDDVLPDVAAALAGPGAAVLVAAPGAGKTTRVPLALLDAPWRGDGRILVLEPRRVAARAAAQQMARLLNESVGETVGYRVRLESRVSARTRIEVLTEGILTRMLQDDPTLDGVAALLFDEFHERHLQSDLGLALALETRQVLRPDLRLLVMSATLDAAPVAELLAAPVIRSAGREYPVETIYRPPRQGVPPAQVVAAATQFALQQGDGDVLVFLPGIAEIQRARSALEDFGVNAELQLLHGGLSLEEQDRVLRRRGDGRRVILSTALAESSVTLEGVRTVVDAGRARVPRYDPRSGMTRLETVRVSRASADQRRGRAGRSAPGRCIRLWDAAEDASLPVRAVPEILESDLTPLALELACAGIHDPTQLQWLDAPPAGSIAQARGLLRDLGALENDDRVTPHGRAMAALGTAPRLAHLVLRGAERGQAALACALAALLAERDILRRERAELDADLRTRLELLMNDRRDAVAAGADVGRLARVRQEAAGLHRSLVQRGLAQRDESRINAEQLEDAGALLALAYPDRVAQRRPGEAARYLLRNGRGAGFTLPQPLGNSPYLAIADLDGHPTESRIWLAAPLTEDELRDAAGASIVRERLVGWDANADAVRAVERERLGAIVLRERALSDVDPAELTDALAAEVLQRGVDALPWGDDGAALRARMAFAHRHLPEEFPDVSDAALGEQAEQWLHPALHGVKRWRDLARVDWPQAVLALLPWALRARLDVVAPTHLQVPSGSRIRVDYTDPAQPALAVKLQECFGWTDTPRLADGRVPLTLQLLSPAGRPVQVTRDLASFWRTGYFDVRRDLKGRYPRHPWPDNPLEATPTRRVKPRGT